MTDGRVTEGTQASAHFEAIKTWQHPIQDYDVGMRLLRGADTGETIIADLHVKALVAEAQADEVRDAAIILHNQSAQAGFGTFCGRRRTLHG